MLKMEQRYTPIGNQKRINVLSIDGGGIRGIVPALILEEIERRTGKPISKLFDVITCTSAGGTLSLVLTKPMLGQPTWADYTASDLVALYEHQGHRFSPKVGCAAYPTGFTEASFQHAA
jgi:patatin-like phospholipase/acyl hydrolase